MNMQKIFDELSELAASQENKRSISKNIKESRRMISSVLTALEKAGLEAPTLKEAYDLLKETSNLMNGKKVDDEDEAPRRRGRPAKKVEDDDAPKKRRGRPKKVEDDDEEEEAPRRRGRPVKSLTKKPVIEIDDDDDDEEEEEEEVQRVSKKQEKEAVKQFDFDDD